MLNNSSPWIAVDWGTSSLRIWAVNPDGTIASTHKSERGMSTLSPADYESVLLNVIEPWLSNTEQTLVIVCGMAGARQGWCEAPYSHVPCHPIDTKRLATVNTEDSRMHVVIVPGVCQLEPADVMRGEETQIAGFLETMGVYDATLCLPGTHAKWVTLENKVITGFTTFMTGELFAVLSNHSILSHSISEQAWCDSAFVKAIHESWHHPEQVSKLLFSIRANSLVNKDVTSPGSSTLSGLLLGVELNLNCRHSTDDVYLIGDSKLMSLYAKAMQALSIGHHVVDADDITLAGLLGVHNALFSSEFNARG